MEENWEKGARREGADSATNSRARIATLAVVQTVYPTIKSDARLCWGNPLASARFKRGEPRTRTREGGGEHRGKEQAAKLDDPRPSSEFSALSLTVSSSHLLAFLSCFFLYQTLSHPMALFAHTSPFPSTRKWPVSRVVEGRNVFVFGLSPDNLRQ